MVQGAVKDKGNLIYVFQARLFSGICEKLDIWISHAKKTIHPFPFAL
jgi:hypothetical protein